MMYCRKLSSDVLLYLANKSLAMRNPQGAGRQFGVGGLAAFSGPLNNILRTRLESQSDSGMITSTPLELEKER